MLLHGLQHCLAGHLHVSFVLYIDLVRCSGDLSAHWDLLRVQERKNKPCLVEKDPCKEYPALLAIPTFSDQHHLCQGPHIRQATI